MDWAATFLAAAGVAPHPGYPLDGMSLLPVLARPVAGDGARALLAMKHRRQRAVRSGAWKYLAMDGHEYLFDLSRDARERANLARRYPERLGELNALRGLGGDHAAGPRRRRRLPRLRRRRHPEPDRLRRADKGPSASLPPSAGRST